MLLVTKIGEPTEFTQTKKDGTVFTLIKWALSLVPVIGKSELPLGVNYTMWVSDRNVVQMAQAFIDGVAIDKGSESGECYDSNIRLALENPTADFILGGIVENTHTDGRIFKNQTVWLKVERGVEGQWAMGAMPVSRVAGNLVALMNVVGVPRVKTAPVVAETVGQTTPF